MTDRKISALTELTTPAADDVLAIVDTSATETKKITVANLRGSAIYGDASDGDITINSDAVTFPSLSGVSAWAPTTLYNVGDIRKSTGTNVRAWRCIRRGTSTGADPLPDDAPGLSLYGYEYVNDGTAIWTQHTKIIANYVEMALFADDLVIEATRTLRQGTGAGFVYPVYAHSATIDGNLTSDATTGEFYGLGVGSASGANGDFGDTAPGEDGASFSMTGGSGGNGGSAGANAGGFGGYVDVRQLFHSLPIAMARWMSSGSNLNIGSAGGGSGAGDGVASGGNGGGGGGLICLFVKSLTLGASATLTAKGSAGSAASGGNAAGGGGGGGGMVYVVTDSLTLSSGAFADYCNTAGGAGGAGSGTGTAGRAGETGPVVLLD